MKKKILKLTSVVVAAALLSNSAAASGTISQISFANNSSTSSKLQKDFFVPEKYGNIEQSIEFRIQDSEKIVIVVKDAHCNYEAQKNISKILEIIIRDYKTDLICVEGASGIVDASFLPIQKDRKKMEQIVDKYIKKGYLCASEALSILKGRTLPFTIYGAEDTDTYLRNFNDFRSAIVKSKDAVKYIENIINVVKQLKLQTFNKDLAVFDEKESDYEDNKINLTDWVRFLSAFKPADKRHKNYLLVLKSISLEENIDFKKIESEREELIKILQNNLNKNEIKRLVEKSLLFRFGRVSSFDYYSYLGEKLSASDLKKSAINLKRYICLVKLESCIKSDALFKEIKEIESEIRDKLFTTESERRLYKTAFNLGLLKKLLLLKLSRDEWINYYTNQNEFSLREILSFVDAELKKNNLDTGFEFSNVKFLDMVKEAINIAESFYNVAVKRDKVLMNNLLKKMKSEKKSSAVIIAGGFHSEGIIKQLKDNNISNIVVTPAITHIQENSTYIDMMMDNGIYLGEVKSKLKADKLSQPLTFSALGEVLYPERAAEVRGALTGKRESIDREVAGAKEIEGAEENRAWKNGITAALGMLFIVIFTGISVPSISHAAMNIAALNTEIISVSPYWLALVCAAGLFLLMRFIVIHERRDDSAYIAGVKSAASEFLIRVFPSYGKNRVSIVTYGRKIGPMVLNLRRLVTEQYLHEMSPSRDAAAEYHNEPFNKIEHEKQLRLKLKDILVELGITENIDIVIDHEISKDIRALEHTLFSILSVARSDSEAVQRNMLREYFETIIKDIDMKQPLLDVIMSLENSIYIPYDRSVANTILAIKLYCATLDIKYEKRRLESGLHILGRYAGLNEKGIIAVVNEIENIIVQGKDVRTLIDKLTAFYNAVTSTTAEPLWSSELLTPRGLKLALIDFFEDIQEGKYSYEVVLLENPISPNKDYEINSLTPEYLVFIISSVMNLLKSPDTFLSFEENNDMLIDYLDTISRILGLSSVDQDSLFSKFKSKFTDIDAVMNDLHAVLSHAGDNKGKLINGLMAVTQKMLLNQYISVRKVAKRMIILMKGNVVDKSVLEYLLSKLVDVRLIERNVQGKIMENIKNRTLDADSFRQIAGWLEDALSLGSEYEVRGKVKNIFEDLANLIPLEDGIVPLVKRKAPNMESIANNLETVAESLLNPDIYKDNSVLRKKLYHHVRTLAELVGKEAKIKQIMGIIMDEYTDIRLLSTELRFLTCGTGSLNMGVVSTRLTGIFINLEEGYYADLEVVAGEVSEFLSRGYNVIISDDYVRLRFNYALSVLTKYLNVGHYSEMIMDMILSNEVDLNKLASDISLEIASAEGNKVKLSKGLINIIRKLSYWNNGYAISISADVNAALPELRDKPESIYDASADTEEDADTLNNPKQRLCKALLEVGILDSEIAKILQLFGQMAYVSSYDPVLETGKIDNDFYTLISQIAETTGLDETDIFSVAVVCGFETKVRERLASMGGLKRIRFEQELRESSGMFDKSIEEIIGDIAQNRYFSKNNENKIKRLLGRLGLYQQCSELKRFFRNIEERKLVIEHPLESVFYNMLKRYEFYRSLLFGAQNDNSVESHRITKCTDFADMPLAVKDKAKAGKAEVSRFAGSNLLSENMRNIITSLNSHKDETPKIISIPVQAVFPELDNLISKTKSGADKAELVYFAGLAAFFGALESSGNKNVRIVLQVDKAEDAISGIKDISTKQGFVEMLIRRAGLEGKVFIGRSISSVSSLVEEQGHMLQSPQKYGISSLKEENISFFTYHDLSSQTETIRPQIKANKVKIFQIDNASQLPSVLLLGYSASSNNVFENSELSEAIRKTLSSLGMTDEEIDAIKNDIFIRVKLVSIKDVLEGFELSLAFDISA